jgi:hypothetical protein
MLKRVFGAKTPEREATPSTERPKILRVHDAMALRYSLGIPFREMFYLLGWPKVLEIGKSTSAHEHGMVLAPSLAILVRMIWNHVEDNPLPPMEDFEAIRKRFAPVSERVGRDRLAHQGWLSILCGFRKNNGNEWTNGKSPTPTTRHMFWMLSLMAERHGAAEAMRRWKQAAEEEASARGVTLEQIFESGSWPHDEEERISGGAANSPSRVGTGRKKAGRPASARRPATTEDGDADPQ